MKSYRNKIIILSILFIIVSCRKTEEPDIKKKQNNISQEQKPVEQFNPKPLAKGYKSFRGKWFKINYPNNFSAEPSIQHKSGEGYESAFFESPDGYVEFYIFAPFHPVENHEIDFNPEKELVVKSESNKVSDYKEVLYYTYIAKDSSYVRSYEETIESDVFRTIIGLKYKNKEAYEYYKDSYLKYKNSLEQYAD